MTETEDSKTPEVAASKTDESFKEEQQERAESLKKLHYAEDPDKMKDALMHHDSPEEATKAKLEAAAAATEAPPSPGRKVLQDIQRMSMRALNLQRDPENKDPQQPGDWGRPGELTADEVKVYEEFQKEIEKRGGDFKATVYCFGEEEGEAYCLCRWLRARKYDLALTIKMVEEATEERSGPKKMDFYPNGREALGCPPSLFLANYPQSYPGFAKNGCPFFISKPGLIDIDAIECITTVEGIIRFHWHIMFHDFAKRLHKAKADNPDFTRFECVCVLDLANLTTAQLNSRTMHIIKVQSFIDSLCFPETMNKMVIVNAPTFFSLSWKIIKGFLDARTVNKIEVISSRKVWEKKLQELVDEDQLPVDYGGKGESTVKAMEREATAEGDVKRREMHLLHLKASGVFEFTLAEGEEADVVIYTRALSAATFEVQNEKKETVAPGVSVKHAGKGEEKEDPTNVTVAKGVKGPGKFKVKATGKGGMLSSAHKYFIVCNIN